VTHQVDQPIAYLAEGKKGNLHLRKELDHHIHPGQQSRPGRNFLERHSHPSGRLLFIQVFELCEMISQDVLAPFTHRDSLRRRHRSSVGYILQKPTNTS
jgi:hypothetical protein